MNSRFSIYIFLLFILSSCGKTTLYKSPGKVSIYNQYNEKYLCVGETNMLIIPPPDSEGDDMGFWFENSYMDGEVYTKEDLENDNYNNIDEYLDEFIDSTEFETWEVEYYTVNDRPVRIRQALNKDSITGFIEMLMTNEDEYLILYADMDREVSGLEEYDKYQVSKNDMNTIKQSMLSVLLTSDISIADIPWFKYNLSLKGTPFRLYNFNDPYIMLTKEKEAWYEGSFISISQAPFKQGIDITEHIQLSEQDSLSIGLIEGDKLVRNEKLVDKNMIINEYSIMNKNELQSNMSYVMMTDYDLTIILWSFSDEYKENKKYLDKIISSIEPK